MAIELFAYTDEGGTQEGAAYCVISGYIASPRQWKLFERDWRAVLQRYSVSDFHASVFFARGRIPPKKNPYIGWSNAKAEQFLEDLTFVISQRRLFPIGGAVDITAFNSFTTGERRYLTVGQLSRSGKWVSSGAPSRPYQLAFVTCLLEATRRADTGTSVHFVFDQNSVEEARAVLAFKEIKGRQAHPLWASLGSITFADRKKFVGLQAADLHTNCWYSYLENRHQLGREQRKALNVLTRKRKKMGYWDKNLMEALLSKATPQERARFKAEM